ncbi:MAG: penicillin-binding protein 2, partial [Boseongicola sp. SB0670_bin_30]|nr:penicillin-binding protein 2 [Boseongicola sp. SB0670_bin_30]
SINDFRNYGPTLSVEDVVVKSSNIGTARIAMMIGEERQKEFLERLGLLSPVPLELVEARTARPLVPRKWSGIHMITVSYGHGISVSPLHLGAAYASLLNGGMKVVPTLVKGAETADERVVSAETSKHMREILRQVVTRGTARQAEVAGYHVAGKTGTADKPKPGGGYHDDKVIATFAGVFPANAPKYVLVVVLDEPVETSGPEPRRTAGWTAVPVAAEIIRRAAPILGLAPDIESPARQGVELAQF